MLYNFVFKNQAFQENIFSSYYLLPPQSTTPQISRNPKIPQKSQKLTKIAPKTFRNTQFQWYFPKADTTYWLEVMTVATWF